MNFNRIRTIIDKEWAEVFKNRMVIFTIAFMPALFTFLPLLILNMLGKNGGMPAGSMPSEVPPQFLAMCKGLSGGECMQIFLMNEFMLMFMMMPLIIPTAIAAYSIVGEKTTRSLEPLLATPITTTELLIGKALAAVIPAVLATYAAFGVFAVGSFIIVRNPILVGALLDARWLLAVFLVGPLMAIMAVSISVMVSSRVNDPRVAEQISMVVILPVLAFFFGQLAGLFVLNKSLILLIALAMVGVDILVTNLAVRLFQREVILTRWK